MYEQMRIERSPSRPAVFIRARTTMDGLPGLLGELYHRVFSFIAKAGVAPTGPPFVKYLTFDEQGMDIEAGVTVSKAIEGEGEIVCQELPGGDMVMTVHKGPYADLKETYEAIQHWVEENGYTFSDGPLEFYVTDPVAEPDRSRHVTLIEWPVVKVQGAGYSPGID